MKLHTHEHTLPCSPAALEQYVSHIRTICQLSPHMFKGGVKQAVLDASMFVYAYVCVSNMFMFVQSNLHYAVFEPNTNQNTPGYLTSSFSTPEDRKRKNIL